MQSETSTLSQEKIWQAGFVPPCRGKRHLWDPGESLLRLAGRGAAQRAGLKDQREGIFTQVRAANDA